MTNLNHFQLPEEINEKKELGLAQKATTTFSAKFMMSLKKLTGWKNAVSSLNRLFGSGIPMQPETLNQMQGLHAKADRTNATLTLILFIVLIMVWRWGIPMLKEVDQLKNDLNEQGQVVQMEQANQASLHRLADYQDELNSNIQKINVALPHSDEKAESVISMLEDMAMGNRMIIDAIGIRLIPDSQMNNDALIGYVEVYEYVFSLESELPNILSFISPIRSSLRLMDIMAMEIEEKEDGFYRAGFVIHAYNLNTLKSKAKPYLQTPHHS